MHSSPPRSAGFAVTVTATVVLLFLSYIRNLKPEGRLVYYLVTILNAVRRPARASAIHTMQDTLQLNTGMHMFAPRKRTPRISVQVLVAACTLPLHLRWRHAQRPNPDSTQPPGDAHRNHSRHSHLCPYLPASPALLPRPCRSLRWRT